VIFHNELTKRKFSTTFGIIKFSLLLQSLCKVDIFEEKKEGKRSLEE